jgi:SsrA-binding protein
MAKKKGKKSEGPKAIATNRKARHDYAILETFEAGMKLTGSEVKSLRQGRATIEQSFAIVEDGEVFLIGMHIPPYPQAGYAQHEPTRKRKLLLHRNEISKLVGKTREKGQTIIPLKCYFRGGHAKIEIALAKGKREYDRREDIKKRDFERSVQRTFHHRGD